MWIICEGVDGSGKTTLAERIADEIRRRYPDDRTEVHHKGVPVKHVLDEYGVDYEHYRPASKRHYVADRHHLGTLIYAPLYRDTGPYGELERYGFRWVELLLAARGARKFIVSQEFEKIVDRLEARGEDYLKPEHVAQVRQRFLDIREYGIDWGLVVPPDGEYPDLVKKIVDLAEQDDANASNLIDWPSYIGTHNPKVLLVGEKRNPNEDPRSESCFMPDSASRAGAFLLDSLPDPFWKDVGITNAYETEDFDILWHRLGEPRVIALGRSASDYLLDIDFDHDAAPHPSYVKRFHNKRKDDYGMLLWSIARHGGFNLAWPK